MHNRKKATRVLAAHGLFESACQSEICSLSYVYRSARAPRARRQEAESIVQDVRGVNRRHRRIAAA